MVPFAAALPDELGLRLDDFILTSNTAFALIEASSSYAACPRCGTPSDRVHSRYRRTVADLPCQDRSVVLRLVVRRFRCTEPACPQRIFCERLPGLLDPHARGTVRLADGHRAIGLALGGEAGSRLAAHLDMPTSPDTLLRRVKTSPVDPQPAPRFIGVDDWALAKGQRYGTIVVDLERGRVLDLLPGRDGEALQRWLQAHPEVEIVTRDRWAPYAEAITDAAPQAQQVADRWHLLKNLREAVERLLERHYPNIRDAFRVADDAPKEVSQPNLESCSVPLPAPPALPPDTSRSSVKQEVRQAKQQRRRERFQRVSELHARGYSLRRIARELRIGKGTVLRYVRSEQCPDWKPGQPRRTRLDGFVAYVDQRVQQGCMKATELFRELTAQGCRSSYDAVRRFLNRRLGAAGRQRERVNAAACPPPAPPSPRKLSFDFIRRAEERKPEQQARLDRVRAAHADLAATLDVAAEFAAIVRKQSDLTLSDWLAKAARTASKEIHTFADGLGTDEAAVTAGLTQAWSNGPVEGQVNRLKTIKRQMYGRAGLPLLRARVLHAA
jgi:transposase